jgi:aryl-alcohol dehydrogenase-like predicted oxidoreductase
LKHRPLGRTGLSVSEICLGTMTWGTQNSEADGHQQMDYAVDCGVNFFDTAEMYPTTPLGAETQGRTEAIIGTWLAARGRRDDIIIATKVTGAGPKWIEDGAPISPAKIHRAIDNSLKRLQTDYIDLYQLHWPNRGSYHFRQTWSFAPWKQDKAARQDIADTLGALKEAVAAGKIRHVGLSNESAWGTMRYLAEAEAQNAPRMASIQNEYSLLHRIYDTDLAELSHHEDVGLLAFSPLAAGILTGKYRNGVVPGGSRRSINHELGGRATERSLAVAEKYIAVAEAHDLDPAQMAIAFCLTRPFMTSVIIGATDMAQLKTDIAGADLVLSDTVMHDIAAIHRDHPIPM